MDSIQKRHKITSYLCILCVYTIIACVVLKLFGYKEFDIPFMSWSIPQTLRRLINCILYVINGLCILLIIVKKKLNVKIIFSSMIILTILFIFSFIPYLKLFTFIFEIIYLIIFAKIILKDKTYKIIIESMLVYLLIFIYQFLTSFYKNIYLFKFSFIESLVLQLDYYSLLLITILTTYKKGDYIYVGRWQTFISIFSKRKSNKENVQQNQENVQQIGYKIFLIVLSIAQLMIVGTACYFVNNVILEFIIIFVSFVFMRQAFGKSYHSDSVLACTSLAIATFIIATRLSLPLWLSTLCNVFIGCLVAYIMHMWYFYARYTNKNGVTLHKGMHLDELDQLCEFSNLSEIAYNRLAMHYVEKKTYQEIADIENVEVITIMQSIRRSRRKLNINPKGELLVKE